MILLLPHLCSARPARQGAAASRAWQRGLRLLLASLLPTLLGLLGHEQQHSLKITRALLALW